MMIRRFAAPMLALSVLVASAAFAQDPGGPPGGGRQGRGQGGGRGQGRGGFGGGMFGMGQEVSLASAPIPALTTALKLSDTQKTQVGEIQQALREQMQQQMRDAFGGGGGFGGDPAARQEMMQQLQDKSKAANKKASTAIEALLTDEQKTAWPEVKKKWDVYQKAGLNIELGESLKLTDEQMKALAEYAKNRPQGGPGGGRPF